MPKLSERDKLIKQLYLRFPTTYGIDRFADFIIEDRKRICAPLIKANKESSYAVFNDTSVKKLKDGIKATLTLAGLEKE